MSNDIPELRGVDQQYDDDVLKKVVIKLFAGSVTHKFHFNANVGTGEIILGFDKVETSSTTIGRSTAKRLDTTANRAETVAKDRLPGAVNVNWPADSIFAYLN